MIMGFMASLGSAARVLGAVVAGWAYQADLTQPCLIVLVICVFLPSCVMWGWHTTYRRVLKTTTPAISHEELLLQELPRHEEQKEEERAKEEEGISSPLQK